MPVCEYGFCLLSLSPLPLPRPHSWAWTWHVLFLPVSSQLGELVFVGGLEQSPKVGGAKLFPASHSAWSCDCVFHSKSKCRWFHSPACLCEAVKGGVQIKGFRIQPMPAVSLCCACLPLSALVSYPVTLKGNSVSYRVAVGTT